MASLVEAVQARAAEQLALPEGVEPSKELPRFKRFLKDESSRLKKLHRSGGLGREVCRARAAVMDAIIAQLFTTAVELAPLGDLKKRPAMAVIAIGGYGRKELNPQSDIDIQFLCDDRLWNGAKPHEYLQSVTDAVLYMLWDLGLKIGHSVRRVQDCVEEANKDMQSKTALIESRLVAGEAALFSRMEQQVNDKCVKPFVNEYIAQRIEDQSARRHKYGAR